VVSDEDNEDTIVPTSSAERCWPYLLDDGVETSYNRFSSVAKSALTRPRRRLRAVSAAAGPTLR
jgi:hypothetical protein